MLSPKTIHSKKELTITVKLHPTNNLRKYLRKKPGIYRKINQTFLSWQVGDTTRPKWAKANRITPERSIRTTKGKHQ